MSLPPSVMFPKLFYVDSTEHSIFLRWETEGGDGPEKSIYRIEMKDETYEWVTKYWGMKTECEVKELGPETLYYFRLGVSLEVGGEEVKSTVLTTATKDAPPMLFYILKSAERGDLRCLSTSLAQRKDSGAIDGFDKCGETALIKAVKRNDIWIVKKLLSRGASVNQCAYGTERSPLIYACTLGHSEILTTLIQAGAELHLPDCNKCVPLHYAADSNKIDILRLCIEAGAEVNIQDSVGWTPLMRAVIFKSSEDIIKELIANGADPKIKDRNGKTAFDLAKINNDNSVLEFLKSFQIENEEIKDAQLSESESELCREQQSKNMEDLSEEDKIVVEETEEQPTEVNEEVTQ